jgi:LysM repeat protein
MRSVLVLVALAGTASAERYVVQRGETLEHVAAAHGCSTDAVLKANHRDNVLVRAGTVVEVPNCRHVVRATAKKQVARDDDDDEAAKARQALDVIDGVTWVDRPSKVTEVADDEPDSQGEPWNGTLEHGTPMPQGDGYVVRRPNRAYGASHVIDHLQDVIAEVRELHPDLHTLAIGDLSARHGGKIANHVSHQTGLDVDVGFYFKQKPDNYPDSFHAADDNLDLGATWALLSAFARTANLETGVQMIFLDYDVQARLYKWAKSRGTPDADLARLFQYPRGRNELAGLVRHWPHHADHLHVRFKSGR